MTDFIIKKEIKYAIDLKGVAIVDTEDSSSVFLEYPEAAVWLLLTERYDLAKLVHMLEAILGKSETETKAYINKCINNWKTTGLIEEDGELINN